MEILPVIFLLGSFSLAYAAFIQYPPVDVGTTMAFFAVGFVIVALLLREGRKESNAVTATYLLAAFLPWVIAGLFFANGKLDHSEEIRHQTVVIERYYGSRWMRDEVVVRSWRVGRTRESVYVSALQAFFSDGERITIGVKAGTLGLPWVSSISR